MRWNWPRSVVNAILGKGPGKTSRLDTATHMAMDADFSGRGVPPTTTREPLRKGEQRKPQPDGDPLEELERIIREGK